MIKSKRLKIGSFSGGGGPFSLLFPLSCFAADVRFPSWDALADDPHEQVVLVLFEAAVVLCCMFVYECE